MPPCPSPCLQAGRDVHAAPTAATFTRRPMTPSQVRYLGEGDVGRSPCGPLPASAVEPRRSLASTAAAACASAAGVGERKDASESSP